MAIQSADIQFVKSQVMDDVPEGGGAPTANVIEDGVSNAIFSDITEVDRAGGKLKVRKTFLTVKTDDQERYMDANVIIERPPADPNVSVVLMTTGETFDRRTDIMDRVEAYFAPGTIYAGWLFGNHLTGQMNVAIAQRVGSELPILGKTLVLRRNEGLPTEISQFIRVRTVTSEVREFVDDGGNYFLLIVLLGIDTALQVDFPGFDPSRFDPGASSLQLRTTIRDATVADATRYYSVTPLAAAASVGDFTVQAQSIYTSLVPSAQTNAPIADARTNQLANGFVAAGSPLVQTVTLAFTTTQALFVGAAAVPGTVTIARDGITLTDAGGRLYNGSTEVGAYDYENGIASLVVNVWGTGGGTFTVTYTPAAVPAAVTQSIGVPVTAENRSLTQVLTLPSPPSRGSLSVAYAVAGRWYVLRDDGTGALRGSDASYGVGTLNYTTGTINVTFGALPDIGAVVYQWVEAAAVSPYAASSLENGGKAFIAINSDGVLTTERGSAKFEPGTITIKWMDGATLRTVTDDGLGGLTGYGTGTLDATDGVIKLSPTTLPEKGTVLTVESAQAIVGSVPTAVAWTSSGGYHTADLGSDIEPGTVAFGVTLIVPIRPVGSAITFGTNAGVWVPVRDDGMGHLVVRAGGGVVQVGTINYSTGVIAVHTSSTTAGIDTSTLNALASMSRIPMHYKIGTGGGDISGMSLAGYVGQHSIGTYYDYTGDMLFTNPTPYAYYGGTASAVADDITVELDTLFIAAEVGSAFQLRNASFDLGSTHYTQLPDGQLVRDISPSTGVGTQAGNVVASSGRILVTHWAEGDSPNVLNWRGAQVPPSDGLSSPYAASTITFRSAAAPLRPSSLSVVGSMLDGTAFNVTVDANGKINGTRVKGRVLLDIGLVEIYGVNPANTDPDAPVVDLTHLAIAGVTTMPADLIRTPGLRYNAVAYSYIPLDAAVIGVDPVRLPNDGRVPFVRAGMFGVVGHTGTLTPGSLVDDMVIDCGRERLSRARLLGPDGLQIHEGYEVDLEAGTITITDAALITGPVTVEHRIEDMALISDAQISGLVQFTRPLTHNFPSGSYLSTALYLGTLYARVSVLFDQVTWTNEWSDAAIGSNATASYNDVASPIEVTNRGAVTERWACVFQSGGTNFQLIGEHVGILGSFSKNEVCEPNNAAAGAPYFSLKPLGWGEGWPAGSVMRFNTVGATTPVTLVQTIQQGPEAGLQHEFRILARGDVDRP